GGDAEHTAWGQKARPREGAHDRVRAFEGGVLEGRVLTGAEPALRAREISHGSQRNEGNGEGEARVEGREERGRVAAEAHAHEADARRAAIAQDARERAQIGDDLAEALVRATRITAGERRSPPAGPRADSVKREDEHGHVESPAVHPADRPRALFEAPV